MVDIQRKAAIVDEAEQLIGTQMNHYLTQSYYEIVNGKYLWHWEPPLFEQLRAEIEVADWGIQYYTVEDNNPSKLQEYRQSRAAAVEKLEAAVKKWKASND